MTALVLVFGIILSVLMIMILMTLSGILRLNARSNVILNQINERLGEPTAASDPESVDSPLIDPDDDIAYLSQVRETEPVSIGLPMDPDDGASYISLIQVTEPVELGNPIDPDDDSIYPEMTWNEELPESTELIDPDDEYSYLGRLSDDSEPVNLGDVIDPDA